LAALASALAAVVKRPVSIDSPGIAAVVVTSYRNVRFIANMLIARNRVTSDTIANVLIAADLIAPDAHCVANMLRA